MDELIQHDISDEEWREYDFIFNDGHSDAVVRVYHIDNPKTLFMRKNGSTHRVLDEGGVVHCIPAPGRYNCVLRWKTKVGADPVKF
jgi:hypothetical protein